MVDHNVMRLYITVHDAFAMAEVEGLEQLKDVVAHVIVLKLRVEGPEIRVVDVFENERWGFALG